MAPLAEKMKQKVSVIGFIFWCVFILVSYIAYLVARVN